MNLIVNKSYQGILIALVLALSGYFIAGNFFDEIHSRLIGVVIFLVTLWTN